MANRRRMFGVLVGGFILLGISILGFIATVDYNNNCRLVDVRERPQGDSVEYYYSELSGGEQQLFDQLQQNRDNSFQSNTCVDGIVRYQDQYYVIESNKTIRWTNPSTLLAIGGIIGAGGILLSVVRWEMESSPW